MAKFENGLNWKVWAGVQCHNNHVIALCLPGVSLSGQLPFSTVRNFIDLQTLSLCFNALSRPLPPISQIVNKSTTSVDLRVVFRPTTSTYRGTTSSASCRRFYLRFSILSV
ncbi:hypothetical protein LguiB_029549 [Lonicera macranthoides]